MTPSNKNSVTQSVKRIRIWYGILLIVLAIFGIRLFYLQIINYSYYRAAALSDQLKQYEIPATRGSIYAHDGGSELPIVLNQKLYVLYADPTFVNKADESASKVAAITGGDAAKYAELMQTKKTRYVVLAKKVSPEQAKSITKLKIPGVGTIAQDYRTYPQGSMAAQVLGFVNDEGKGKYGVEQYMNRQLTGTPGQLKAITDANGVPLAASKDNISVPPKNGQSVVLTLDLAMQQQLENILAQGVKKAKAVGGSALIMDPRTGAVKAMANVPTYDPSQYFNVEDGALFQNQAVSHPIEVGSTMKALTTAAAINQGVINENTSYYDPASWKVNDFKITNIEEDGGAGTRNIKELLNLSLNTGATWELMQMGGGQINLKARQAWYDYLVNHYMFGRETGLEQGYEATGYVPRPEDNGAGINLTYANTAFGQAMTATPIQMGAALSVVVNGGTYYKPRLVEKIGDASGNLNKVDPVIVKKDVVSARTSQAMIPLMQYVVEHHTFSPGFDFKNFIVGGKTGTAQIAKPGGGYHDNQFNGTYTGFVGGDQAQYVVVVFIQKPTIGGYAGTAAAQPVFGSLVHMLINNSYVTPKKQP